MTKSTNPSVLTVNGGSSSIKFALFEANKAMRRILQGQVEGVGTRRGNFTAKGLNATDNFSRRVKVPDHAAAVNVLMDWIQERIERGTLAAVGHRVVHGGPK
jgi:acetate kinase